MIQNSEKAVSRELLATARAFQQLADQTIKKDPVRAIVEIITNSDDSYKKLERLGIDHDGVIVIKIKRWKSSGRFKITDHAEGMSAELLDKAVGMYGSETHGFEAGEGGRSFFGRGLKEAILSMGEGFDRSIHNNYYHECFLNIKKYEREKPKEATQSDKGKLGIPSRGVEITLVADRSGIKIPQFECLKRSVEFYYALRDILSSPRRNVFLIEEDNNNQEKNRVRLSYAKPKGKPIINETKVFEDFENATASLEVYSSEEPLTGRAEGYIRQNGILICSSGAIHDITLFRFENDDLANNLFGRLTCDYIDVLLRKGESIISDSRDGLDRSHKFYQKLKEFAENRLEKYISEERKKLQIEEKIIESNKTQKKFKKAISELNKIATSELKEISKFGVGKFDGGMLPPNGFDFVPNYYDILVGKKSTLTLKMNKDLYENNRSKIKITSDTPRIEILTDEIIVDPNVADSVLVEHIYIEGKQIGEEGQISAIAGDLRAKAQIHVVAKREFGPSHPRKKYRGMFREIKYSSNADPNQRVRYDKETGVILIATMAPSVKLYLGLNGEGQEKPESQALTAELVTQAVCRELAKLRVQSGEPILGEPEEALNVIYNRLINKYAHIIHKVLGP